MLVETILSIYLSLLLHDVAAHDAVAGSTEHAVLAVPLNGKDALTCGHGNGLNGEVAGSRVKQLDCPVNASTGNGELAAWPTRQARDHA